MPEQKVSFPGGQGQRLSGVLAVPVGTARGWIVFAHCFTCGKDLRAARTIARSLCEEGWGVLRFDFTGIGQSEGDFAEGTFSGNVADLVEAGRWLEGEHGAPVVLVGHSWGGTAAVAAGALLPSVKGVVTVGAPADPAHVVHLFKDSLDVIRERGRAEVLLAGRPFTIGRELVEDVAGQRLERILQEGGRALLVMHSPQDELVSVEHATRLYKFARHPKSFVSLDGADHLLSDPAAADWVGRMIAAWSGRLVPTVARSFELVPHGEGERGEVGVRIGRSGLAVELAAGRHHWVGDEPLGVGGTDRGPTPYEMLLGSLGACTAMTLRLYADRKGWPLEGVDVRLHHAEAHVGGGERLVTLQREIALEGPLDGDQRARLLEIADRCPVHRTLHGEIIVETTEVAPGQ